MVLFLHIILICISAVIAQRTLDYDLIRNTLSRYPLAIDGKKFSDLSLVFTNDAVGYYPTPLNTLTGLPDIETQLEASLRPVQTHHSYGTQEITIHNNGTADTVTYYTASHFGVGVWEGQVYYVYGKYNDHLLWTRHGWRINVRELINWGSGQGNILIFTGTESANGSMKH